MASIVNDPGGRRRIQFIDASGDRKTIYLGKMDRKAAEAVKVRVERLAAAQAIGHPPDDETSRWVMNLEEKIHDKLSAVGLVPARDTVRLGPWLEKYLGERKDLKPGSRRKLCQTQSKLLAAFGESKVIRALTPNDAAEWRAKMQAAGLSEAAMKIHAGNAKTFFNEAQRRKLISENPFLHLPSGPTASTNQCYVTPDEAAKIVAAIPDIRYRTIFALARYAGLRTPSETHLLTWKDVDWHKCRMKVRSPKTERHAGHESRIVPACPALMKVLRDAYEAAPEGTLKIAQVCEAGYTREIVWRCVDAAGVKRWDDLW